MRTGKGDISGWLVRLESRPLWVGFTRVLLAGALLACLVTWPSLALGLVRACRRPRGGRSALRWCAGVLVDVVLSSVFPYVRPVRRRTVRRAVTLCAGLCVSVAGRRR